MKKTQDKIGIYEIIEHFIYNLKRITQILKESFRLLDSTQEFKNYADEILRISVVFIHASLEDFLREFVRIRFKENPLKIIDEVPLVGFSPISRPLKFSLKNLIKHKRKTVEGLINESIDEYLDRISFNSTTDIANALKKSGIDISKLRKYFSQLNEMIERRHRIVHRADRIGIPGNTELCSINSTSVEDWVKAVCAFIYTLVIVAEPSGLDVKSALKEIEKLENI